MLTSRTANELTIQETPGCLWFIGAFFAFVGGSFVFGALGAFSNLGQSPIWQVVLAFLMGSISIGVGFWIIHSAPISKLVIDRFDERIILTRRRLFERSEDIYSFEDVERFCQIQDIDDEGILVWFFGMDLTEGETITITSLASHTDDFQQKYVFEANEFARKSLPTWESVLKIDERIG